MIKTPQCWCGNTDLSFFSPAYLQCPACHSLILKQMPQTDVTHVTDDERDLYGRNYYLNHLPEQYGHADIFTRVRADLPERCLHWLCTLLKYKPPPARVLELGSGHGGFVAMLQWAGFEASGLELSPWLVNFAREIFHIPMLLGPVEDQSIDLGFLDVIALMDVLEHLPDPTGTMQHCLNLLKPDGILLIQTPCLPDDSNYEQLQANNDPFLKQLKEKEHLYLFSHQSIRQFFYELDAEYTIFEPAIFAHYDMFLVVSRAPVTVHSSKQIERTLGGTSGGRLIQALIDLDDETNRFKLKWQEAEADRADRLKVIEEQGDKIDHLQQQIAQSQQQLAQSQQQLAQKEGELRLLQSQKIFKALKRVKLIKDQKATSKLDPDQRYFFESIREPKHLGGVEFKPDTVDKIITGLQSFGYEVKPYRIDVADYKAYFEQAAYKVEYPSYYDFNLPEKSLEHYIAAKLLNLNAEDVYIDIASEHSPVPEIYHRLFGSTTYKQDLSYPPGLNGDTIGGDAANMDVPNGFASKMALHCSFEHFEEDSDVNFIQEARRVLKPGGAVCIVPLYLFEKYAIQTDPSESVPQNVRFEDDAVIYCHPAWKNRHARFYDPAHLYERVHKQLDDMTMTIYKVTNAKDVDPSCYVEFAALITKPWPGV